MKHYYQTNMIYEHDDYERCRYQNVFNSRSDKLIGAFQEIRYCHYCGAFSDTHTCPECGCATEVTRRFHDWHGTSWFYLRRDLISGERALSGMQDGIRTFYRFRSKYARKFVAWALHHYRRLHGITQLQLAKESGMSHALISRLENAISQRIQFASFIRFKNLNLFDEQLLNACFVIEKQQFNPADWRKQWYEYFNMKI